MSGIEEQYVFLYESIYYYIFFLSAPVLNYFNIDFIRYRMYNYF